MSSRGVSRGLGTSGCGGAPGWPDLWPGQGTVSAHNCPELRAASPWFPERISCACVCACAKPLPECLPFHPLAPARGHLSQEAPLPSDLLLCPSPGRPRTLSPGHRGYRVQPQALPKPPTHASTRPAYGPHPHRTRRTYGPWARPPCPAVTRSRGVSVPRPPSPVGLHPAPAFSPGGSQLGGGQVRLGQREGPTLPQGRPYPEGLRWSGWRQNPSSPIRAGPSCNSLPV